MGKERGIQASLQICPLLRNSAEDLRHQVLLDGAL